MRIAMIANLNKEHALQTVERLITLLGAGAEVIAEKALEPFIKGFAAKEDAELFQSADAVVVLGGDGTILSAARRCAVYGSPIIGINMGHLGFLTTMESGNIEAAAKKILDFDFQIEERMMLRAEIMGGGQILAAYHALNDAVVCRAVPDRILNLSITERGGFVSDFCADGVVLATPTGSTAYSLSCGGPLAYPSAQMILVTPICPHALSARPMVMQPDADIRICARGEARLSIDGQDGRELMPGETVRITKSPYLTRLARIEGKDFYSLVETKLGGRFSHET
ncbi:MAG: NAD(+)/NADH kinase [Clostridia bacterium]|nr:NAD(+)/NADH kinase [Clostridia bacterium]